MKSFTLRKIKFLVRPTHGRPQYGMLWWSAASRHWAFDVWIHKTLYTVTITE